MRTVHGQHYVNKTEQYVRRLNALRVHSVSNLPNLTRNKNRTGPEFSTLGYEQAWNDAARSLQISENQKGVRFKKLEKINQTLKTFVCPLDSAAF